MSIGLVRGTVALEPHCIEWEQSANKLIVELKELFKNDIVDVQHIGSTSIRSIEAKPIVDIAIGVADFDTVLKYNDRLKEYGIFYRGQDHPGQLLYVCSDEENVLQTHYIHVVIWGHDEWNNYINMRDYLNSHEDDAREYSELKKRLGQEFPNDRNAYTNGKSLYIEGILEKARKWKLSTK